MRGIYWVAELLYDAIYPNGIATAYTYDNLNRLTRLKADLGATPVTDFQYVYDDAGNRTRKQQLDYTEDYSYDPLYRLTGVSRSAGGTGVWQFGYDPVGNRASAQLDSSVSTSVYNEKNQLTNSTGGGPLRWRGTLDEPGSVAFTSALVNGKPAKMLQGNVFETTLDMVAGNNTVTIQATDVSGNVTTKNYQVNVAGNGATYTYDLNGNLTQKVEGADTWTYEWNAENLLTRVTKNSLEQARFNYDPIGRRVEKIAGGLTTAFTYANDDILRQLAGSSTLKYVYGPGIDEPLATDDGSTLNYFQADGLGSPVKTTNSSGAVTLTRQYDAWGSQQLGMNAGYAFTGREWDPETNLYYYRARYYDAKIGRFISEDPIRFDGGINFYQYASNDPVIFTDPSGLKILVCNRPAELPLPGGPSHAYFWDTRGTSRGGSRSVYHRNCGRGSKSGKETGPGTPGTVCYEVPDSTGREDDLLYCCEKTANDATFVLGTPFGWSGLPNQHINDCHTSLYRCLYKAKLDSPPHPRFGCRSCGGPNESPNDYGGSQ